MDAVPVLETERLRLRGYRGEDFPFFRDMWADPEVVRHIAGGKPRMEEETWTKFLRMIGHWRVMGYGFWAVEEKASGAPVGEAGFCDFRRDMTPSNRGEPEMGWALAAPAHGKGYATEAVRAALAWGDRRFAGKRMSCIIDPGNTASIRVAEKCGFKLAVRAVYHGEEILLFRREASNSPGP